MPPGGSEAGASGSRWQVRGGAADPGCSPDFCFPLKHLSTALAVADQVLVEVPPPFISPSSLSETVRTFLEALTNAKRRTEGKQKVNALRTCH